MQSLFIVTATKSCQYLKLPRNRIGWDTTYEDSANYFDLSQRDHPITPIVRPIQELFCDHHQSGRLSFDESPQYSNVYHHRRSKFQPLLRTFTLHRRSEHHHQHDFYFERLLFIGAPSIIISSTSTPNVYLSSTCRRP